jgi:glycosyltransferase involved in cell wall biosynthesis
VSEALVSVVIPVRDGERYLRETVQSVLEQSYDAIEVVAVDDGSRDGTGAMLRAMEPEIRWARQEASGVNAAMNRGVRMAGGSFLAFIDADDLWTETKLELQMARLAGDAELDAVFGHVRNFVSAGLSVEQRSAIACPPEPMPGMSAGTMLIRREAFDRIGDFDTELQVGGFIDWYARATELGLVSAMLPDVVMLRRLHGANTTLRAPEARVDYTRVARAALRRRRAR